MENVTHVMSSSRFSALGAGAHDTLGSELIDAPEEEEEFDVLNDETFGNCEGDWDEEEHKRLAELEELQEESFFDFQLPDHTKDSGYGTAERSYRSQEEFLEQSISRLMDETDEEEKGRLFFGRGQPIPHTRQHGHANLDHLFGPSSPPALMDTQQLVSPKSKNIWGSPANENVLQKPADALRKLFDTAKASQPMGMESVMRAAPPSFPSQSPMTLPQAHTVEEIERQMLAKGRKPQVLTAEELERQLRGEESPRSHDSTSHIVNHHPQIGPPPQLPPTEESQYALGSTPPKGSQPPMMMGVPPHLPPGLLPAALLGASRVPFPLPPMVHPMVHPMVAPVTPQGRPPAGMSPISQQHVSNGRSSPIPIKGLPQHLMQPASPQMTPGQTMTSSMGRSTSTPTPPLVRGMPPHISSAHATRLINAYNIASAAALGNSPIPAGFGNRMMTPPPGVHPMPHGPVPRMPPMPLSPMGTPPHARLPPPVYPGMQDVSQPGPGQSVHERRPDTQPSQQAPASDKHLAYRTNYQRPPPWQKNRPLRQEHQPLRQGDEVEEDEYEGLMTKKEKDWIIKIQLLQLNTDNPYLDDYYYTYYILRKQQRESGTMEGMERFLIPNLARIESTKTYAPAQFEGSLGRLTTASVHNPRHIIDVSRGSSPTDDTSKKNVSKELRKFRQLLMDIEKGYVLLLDIDDLEKKVLATPEDNRMPLFVERQEMITRLYHYFTCDESIENYMQILGVRKGRKLLARVLPLFRKDHAHVVLCILFHHLYALVKKDTGEEGLKCLTRSVCCAIEGADLDSLVRLVNILKGEKSSQAGAFLQPLLRNQFGAVLLCALINEGEKVFQDTSPVDMDNQQQTEWHRFVEQFVEGVESVPQTSLPTSPFPLPLVESHLSRQLNPQLVARVEEKLHHLTHPPPPPNSKTAATS